MTTTNTYGKQVVVPLTNKSGGGVIAGDVVIVDTTNNDAFTTTTSAAFTGLVGVAQDTIASNAAGRVLIGGYAALINVNASVTRGHYGATHTVAKQAADAGASRTSGTFVQFLTGGTTPDGTVFNPDLGTGGSTIITKDEGSTLSSSVTTLDFVGAGVTASGAGATTTVTVPGVLLAMKLNTAGGNKTTTSASQSDVDATNAVVTFTAPASGNVLVRVTCTANIGVVNVNSFMGLRESTTDLVNGSTGTFFIQGTGGANGTELLAVWTAYLTGVSGGSHTYKVSFAINSSQTLTIRASASNPMTIEVWAAP